jgi:hypothetical protein
MDGDTTHTLRQRLDDYEARTLSNAEKIARIESCLADNTKMTREMYDYLITARTGTKMIKGAAVVLSALSALGVAVAWLRDHIHL